MFWKRKHRQQEAPQKFAHKSPFDGDTIRPGDPGWAAWERMQETGQAVIGRYDTETGEIVSMEDVPLNERIRSCCPGEHRRDESCLLRDRDPEQL